MNDECGNGPEEVEPTIEQCQKNLRDRLGFLSCELIKKQTGPDPLDFL